MLSSNELVFTFGGSYVCANFGENRSRNATVRVPTDGHTDWQTHCQTQTDFIICPMLYAIAMGQTITVILHIFHCACAKQPYFHIQCNIWRHHPVPRPMGGGAIVKCVCLFPLRSPSPFPFPLSLLPFLFSSFLPSFPSPPFLPRSLSLPSFFVPPNSLFPFSSPPSPLLWLRDLGSA